jgi:hypothetical protein
VLLLLLLLQAAQGTQGVRCLQLTSIQCYCWRTVLMYSTAYTIVQRADSSTKQQYMSIMQVQPGTGQHQVQ